MKQKFLSFYSALKENVEIAKATSDIQFASYSIAEGILKDADMVELVHYALTTFPSSEIFKGRPGVDENTLDRYNDATDYLARAIIKISMAKDAPTYPVFYNNLFLVTHAGVGSWGSDQANLANILIQATLINPGMPTFDYLADIKQSNMALIKKQIDDCGGAINALYDPKSTFKLS